MRYFVTFGNSPDEPYSADEYVVVLADNACQATRKYERRYPSKSPFGMNCREIYREDAFESIRHHYGRPAEIIR